MINALSLYAKNIATFLIFITLIGIILPSDKYKNYINLILGFIMIFIVLKPVSEIFNKDKFDNIFAKMSLTMNQSVMQKENIYFEDEQNSMIMDVYIKNLKEQIKMIGNNQNDFEIIDADLTINQTEDNFGEIMQINLQVTKKPEQVQKQKLIRIEPIKNKINKETVNQDLEEINNLKLFFLDFYNLSEQNININVQ